MKVSNMTSPRGNRVANQFIIEDGETRYFQSYRSIIAKVSFNGCRIVELDSHYWDYSRTTSKYLGMFLGESMADVRKKVKSGEYKLANLN